MSPTDELITIRVSDLHRLYLLPSVLDWDEPRDAWEAFIARVRDAAVVHVRGSEDQIIEVDRKFRHSVKGDV